MYAFLMVVHVFVCLVLIAVILLQAGKGGGLADFAGGNQAQSILGTQTNTFMTRATEVCAIIFVITSLSLGILSTQKGKSLIEKEIAAGKFKPVQTKAAAPAPAAEQAQDAVQKAVEQAKTEAPAVQAEAAPVVEAVATEAKAAQ